MKPQPTLFQTIQHEIEKEKKLIRRKKFLLKLKVFLCLILPAVITLLTVKVIKTYLKIKLKNAVIPGLKKKTEPKHLKKEPAGETQLVPQPVGEPYKPEPVEITTDDHAG